MKKSFLLAVLLAAAQVHAGSGIQHISPSPELPFTRAVRAGDTVYVSGQIGASAEGLAQGFAAQSHQTMNNIAKILKDAGLTMDDVVKCTVFIQDMRNWPAFNDIYKTYFKPGRYPARSALGANGLALNADVEVECIAYQPAPQAK